MKGIRQYSKNKYKVLNLKIIEKFILSTGYCVIAKIAISFSSEALGFLKNAALYDDLKEIAIKWIDQYYHLV